MNAISMSTKLNVTRNTVGLVLGLVVLTSSAVAQVADPFVGGVWHAVEGTWPGTLKFDGSKKEVVLTPVGAPEIHATYKVDMAKPSRAKVQTGTLLMTNTLGQKSQSTFKVSEKKRLELTFSGGQRPETYIRMTPAEEARERQRIEKLIAEGKLPGAAKPATGKVELP